MKTIITSALSMAGISATVAGFCCVIVGVFHPANVPEIVTSANWISVHIFAMLMCFFGMFGMAGLYARQAGKVGWLGFIGFALMSIWFALVLCFSFIESFILPIMAAELPVFVEGFLGMFSGQQSTIDLGILPTLWMLSGPMYILGPLLFGIATYRAGIFPRRAAGLLIAASLLTPVGAILPPALESLILVPVGIAMGWLGYSLWFEQRRNHSSV